MKTLTNTLVTTLLLAMAHPAAADAVTRENPIQGNADLCYWQTVLAGQGADPDALSTAPCDRALRYTPMRRNDRSIVLYNRSIVELAKGDTAAGRTSLERAVAMSRTVDMRNLALAQLAHKQGDLALAIEQYALLLNSPKVAPELAAHRETIAANHDRAMDRLEQRTADDELAMITGQ